MKLFWDRRGCMVELWTLATLGKCELMLGLLAPNLPFMREAREEKKKSSSNGR